MVSEPHQGRQNFRELRAGPLAPWRQQQPEAGRGPRTHPLSASGVGTTIWFCHLSRLVGVQPVSSCLFKRSACSGSECGCAGRGLWARTTSEVLENFPRRMGSAGFLERPLGPRQVSRGQLPTCCQGEFLPEATMHGLLNVYRTCSEGC